ncbi:hypothetical protein ACGFNU_44155 [Spirillospora sp. NPDC048911]|uniref:hypothetical protein n=1 Tax=Spirillospora sp. NPDC048911 TaxID=3364527 RepID=UPI0037206A17
MPDDDDAIFTDPAVLASHGAAVMDHYQRNYDDLDHRTSTDDASEGLSFLLADLMHYAESRGVDFEGALKDARLGYADERLGPGEFVISSTVQVTGTRAAEREATGRATKGQVTGYLTQPEGGQTIYHVAFLGEVNSHQIPPDALRSAPPFPQVPTLAGPVTTMLDAEAALVDTTLRIELSDAPGSTLRLQDIRDHRVLITALCDWTGLGPAQISRLLRPRVNAKLRASGPDPEMPTTSQDATAPAQLAAKDFPVSLHTAGAAEPHNANHPAAPSPSRDRPAANPKNHR